MAAKVALVGFGEAGQAFAKGWHEAGAGPVTAFDVKAPDAHLAERAEAFAVALQADRAAALAGSPVVFCLVTADRAIQAAEECAPFLAPGALWFDGNSCAPDNKRRAARIVEAAGARYVDCAIMAPVHPRLHRTPLLLAGPHGTPATEVLATLGMAGVVAGSEVGQASTIKMLRSVMVKGMEALTAECFLAARKAGVEAQVLASLAGSNPEIPWERQGAYNLERMIAHGLRRAAEMREVVVTLGDLGFAGALTGAVAEWHQAIGQMGLGAEAATTLAARADLILARLAGGS